MAISIFKASLSRSLPFLSTSTATLRYSNPKNGNSNKLLPCCAPPGTNHLPPRSQLSFCVGTRLIPHPDKVERGGEDAFFVSSYNGGVIAVADGVSGWAEKNVDPSLFPRELMSNASSLVENEEVNYDPQVLLRKAHAATSSIGSATVIVAMLERNGALKIANVGDCGLKVSNVELMEGDTIVMGSDGLFDNVFEHEIVSTVATKNNVSEAGGKLDDITVIVGQTSFKNGVSVFLTPSLDVSSHPASEGGDVEDVVIED
ncbi:hypothetical protein Tsubulata_000392 [Turnera subulata]|uniref:Protein phosphatase n=1 Tax=Turnera subulata TaxID=218843 RepID=A0A9Q0JG40_9ROSI|nr:hypothetical protein Tsubulata_000392 [Turnera subulata]